MKVEIQFFDFIYQNYQEKPHQIMRGIIHLYSMWKIRKSQCMWNVHIISTFFSESVLSIWQPKRSLTGFSMAQFSWKLWGNGGICFHLVTESVTQSIQLNTSRCFSDILVDYCIAFCPDTQRKKGTKTVPLGYYCYKWYPFFEGALFFP